MAAPNFTLVQLRYFLAVAEAGSMTAASRTLMVSQSAISTAVAHLEKELGVQLAIRHHARGLTLTKSGESFLSELRSFLIHADDLTEAARGLGGSLVGDLTLGCFSTISPFYLPRLLAAYEQRHPQVHVTVFEDEHAYLLRALREGRCEVALLYGYDLGPDVRYEVLDRIPPYVLVAHNHRLARRAAVRLRELAEEPMVLLDLPHSREYFRRILESAEVEPTVRRTSANYETIRALVAHGQGWSLLNQQPRSNTTYDGTMVAALRLKDPVPPLDLVLAAPASVRPTRRVVAFADCARQVLIDGTAD
jgi:DNA-binding transcriptional LysR family regulator